MLIQSFVTPIFTYTINEKKSPEVRRLKGTGFFLNNGLLITAAHVLDRALIDVETGQAGGICANPMINDDYGVSRNLFIDISTYERAPKPYDVALAVTNYEGEINRNIGKIDATIADHVTAIGYPDDASQIVVPTTYIQARAHRGYIQRVIPKNRFQVGVDSPVTYELDFAITAGMSGSPLIFNTGKEECVIGVCIGSHTSRIVDYSITEVDENGSKFTEVQQRIQEYGAAHSLIELLDWRPAILNGKSLKETLE